MFVALLDTCVLWPNLQRDFLLSLAVERLYRPAWSSMILAELEYEEAVKCVGRGENKDAAARRGARLVSQMRAAFADAEVSGWEALEGTYGLPDADDEHVAAAAFTAGARVIVTRNLKDFPADRLPRGIEVAAPSQFAHNVVALDPRQAWVAIETMATRSGRWGPSVSAFAILELLESRYGMVEACCLL
jgi:predicted nucleic acid-binding protein